MEPLDLPAVLLALVVRVFAGDRAEWGQAMLGELARIERKRDRWRFALGCTRATVFAAPRQHASGRLFIGIVCAAVAASVGLVAYGFARYPELRLGASTKVYLVLFLISLAGYVLITVAVVRKLRATGREPMRVGLLGGAVLTALAVVIGAGALTQRAGTVLMVAFVGVAIMIGAVGAVRSGRTAGGRHAVMLAGVVAGLGVFVIWVGDTLVTAGPTAEGDHLLAAGAGQTGLTTTGATVDDSLGGAMGLLVLIPLLVMTVGFLGAVLGRRLTPRPPAH